jgi:hypothetical protein
MAILLLIDNWALLDSGCRQVERYVDLACPWYTFMVIRDEADPEARARDEELRGVVHATLGATLDTLRVGLRFGASGDASRGRLREDFSLLAQAAVRGFVRH